MSMTPPSCGGTKIPGTKSPPLSIHACHVDMDGWMYLGGRYHNEGEGMAVEENEVEEMGFWCVQFPE